MTRDRHHIIYMNNIQYMKCHKFEACQACYVLTAKLKFKQTGGEDSEVCDTYSLSALQQWNISFLRQNWEPHCRIQH